MQTKVLIPLATVCGFCGVLTSCSSKNGVEGSDSSSGAGGYKTATSTASAGATGGANFVLAGGASAAGNGSMGGAADTGGSACAVNDVPIQAAPPDIMIIQDRSLSMTDDVNDRACAGGSLSGNGNCGPSSKWALTIAAVESVVQDTQASVNWGMWWLGAEPDVCGASTTPVVPMTYIPNDSYSPIQSALETNDFSGALGTPTAAVMTNALAYMRTLTDSNPKFFLLATDGEPNCSRGNLNSTDATGATSAIQAAAAAGIPTFVVGIGDISNATSILDAMARAGGKPQTGAATQYYAVTDTASLQAALTTIVGQALSCTISLENTPKGNWTIAISADDANGNTVLVPTSASDGWAYTDTNRTSITLTGSFCDGLKSGAYSNFHFVYTCEGGTITIQ